MDHQNDRVIFHCDCNSFFASVETLDRPELANVPMAVASKTTGIRKWVRHWPESWQKMELRVLTPIIDTIPGRLFRILLKTAQPRWHGQQSIFGTTAAAESCL
jgi:hypothetical protein